MPFDESTVRQMFRDAGVKEKIIGGVTAEASLVDAGVDSLDFANVLLSIEERYGLKIPDEEALALDSLASMAAYVNARLTGGQI